MNKNDKLSLEDIQKVINVKFEATGFPTEEQVALTLLKDNWFVIRNARYQVKGDEHYHEVDIIARKTLSIHNIKIQLLLVIECKKQEKYPWIFPISSIQVRNPMAITFIAKEEAYDLIYSKVIYKKFSNHYYHDAQASTVHISPYYLFGKEKEINLDPIQKAIYQVLNHVKEIAGLEYNAIKQAVPNLSFIYPVIVLNGQLITCTNKGVIQETNHVFYLIELLAKEPASFGGRIHTVKPFVIDIVTLSHLNEFLQLVQKKGVPI